MDTTDFNASNPLFENSFFKKLTKILSRCGILVFNGLCANWSSDKVNNLVSQQRQFFNYSTIYQAYIPMYGDGHFCFVISSQHKDPSQWIPTIGISIENKPIKTKYYNLDVHKAAFKLPEDLKQKILYDCDNLDEILPETIEKNKPYCFGDHVTLNMEGCTFELLNSEQILIDLLKFACVKVGNLTVVGETFHKFQPQGVTICLLLATSHATIHTWPEHGKCAIDIFTCNKKNNIGNIVDFLIAKTLSLHLVFEKIR
jgi:S-adenosylmethionine decarboxylase